MEIFNINLFICKGKIPTIKISKEDEGWAIGWPIKLMIGNVAMFFEDDEDLIKFKNKIDEEFEFRKIGKENRNEY